MTDNPETLEAARQRYTAAAHAMQSGVALKMNHDQAETSPKHLRVGVNSTMVSNGALVKLLCDKGLITLAEYTSALADSMEEERDSYLRELRERFGNPNIHLH